MTSVTKNENINTDLQSEELRDFLIQKKLEILSKSRLDIDGLYDMINSDQKNIDTLVGILQKNLT